MKILAHAILILGMSFTACSTAPKKMVTSTISGDLVFPHGVYQHAVQLQIQGKQEHHFRGVVQLKPNLIQVVALSAFGTTVFKIMDHLDQNRVECDIYVEPMKKYEPKLLEYYAILKRVLTARNSAILQTGAEPELKHSFGKRDQNQIPESIHIESEHFNADIKVTGYEI